MKEFRIIIYLLIAIFISSCVKVKRDGIWIGAYREYKSDDTVITSPVNLIIVFEKDSIEFINLQSYYFSEPTRLNRHKYIYKKNNLIIENDTFNLSYTNDTLKLSLDERTTILTRMTNEKVNLSTSLKGKEFKIKVDEFEYSQEFLTDSEYIFTDTNFLRNNSINKHKWTIEKFRGYYFLIDQFSEAPFLLKKDWKDSLLFYNFYKKNSEIILVQKNNVIDTTGLKGIWSWEDNDGKILLPPPPPNIIDTIPEDIKIEITKDSIFMKYYYWNYRYKYFLNANNNLMILKGKHNDKYIKIQEISAKRIKLRLFNYPWSEILPNEYFLFKK